jgi:hypothetical protein
MMPARTRPYLPSGLYRRQPSSPEVEQAMAALGAQMIDDKGGPENVSTAERILIDLGVAAAMKHEAVARYLLTLPSLVDKRHRRVWQVVRDANALAAHLQGLLRDLGVERRAKPVPDLGTYLAQRTAQPAPDRDPGASS